MAKVFLSYAREDTAAAKQLAAGIDRAGHQVWWDHQIQGGTRFAAEIDRELKNADVVVVLWTKTSVESPWVQDEAAEGRDAGRLLPLIMDTEKPPLGFRQFQSIDISGWDAEADSPALGSVLEAINQKCSESQPKAAASKPDAKGKTHRASVCVLPFANMSGDPEQEYFSDGITEDIITDLSKVSSLGIIARNSAFMFKGKQVDILKVARELKVSHVLEGSVRKAGGRIRINAQLVDGETNSHVWADRYDRDSSDIFALQDEISEAIVKALKLRLLPEEKKAIERRGTSNAEAHNLYLMARQTYITSQEYETRSAEAIVRLAKRATEIDPTYAQAWALMAIGHGKLRLARGGGSGEGMAAAERWSVPA